MKSIRREIEEVNLKNSRAIEANRRRYILGLLKVELPMLLIFVASIAYAIYNITKYRL